MINHFDGEYEFLSNFYPSPIKCKFTTIDGEISDIIDFPTVEHYFQAFKSKTLTGARVIAAAVTPGRAKRLGRQVELRPDWEEIKEDVMYRALWLKFHIPELKEKLLATGDEELVEGTTWNDRYWGVDLETGIGKNRLGKLLMELREELKDD